MFLILFLGVLVIASVAAVVTDVRSDGYDYHANQKVLQLS